MTSAASASPDGFAAAAFWSVALGPLALLLGALAFEHWGGLAPCQLCLFQRGPLVAAAILGVFAVLIRPVPGTTLALRHLLAASALLLVLGAGLAFYHMGVEWHWWPGPTTCIGTRDLPTTPEALAAARESARIVRCDVVPWQMLGLSLAGYNFLISSALAVLAFMSARRIGS